MSKRKMHLVSYLKTGPSAMHSGAWRHPDSRVDDIFSPIRYERIAQVLEAAKFDAAFFADFFGVADTYKDSFATVIRSGAQNSYLDPMSVLPLMARVTRHLGLAATVSTSFFNAFHLARSLASVDILSGGRIGWNVVTSANNSEAKNAGMPEMHAHDERYDRADEVLEACMALWHSWDPDALVLDKAAGIFADPSKVRYANYQGKWTSTRGPLPTPPSPQGHPVIMQAGGSPRGREFAAKWAEIVFAPSAEREALREFCKDIKQRVAAAGRDPDKVKILPGITPILGETDSIAAEKADHLDRLEDPEWAVAFSSVSAGADLSKYKTEEEVNKVRGTQGTLTQDMVAREVAARDKISFSEASTRWPREEGMTGTASTVADTMQDLFESGICDGFIIMPTTFPASIEQFCTAVVPELQRRGIFRTEYAAETLRGNLLA
jgi:FMN-dependent oxidoreductase (nitrilotriacetate monooxygenase family)